MPISTRRSTEAKEAYVTRNPKSFARFVEATAVMPGGNTRTVLHYAPFPSASPAARAAGCGTSTARSTSTSSANTPPVSMATRIR